MLYKLCFAFLNRQYVVSVVVKPCNSFVHFCVLFPLLLLQFEAERGPAGALV